MKILVAAPGTQMAVALPAQLAQRDHQCQLYALDATASLIAALPGADLVVTAMAVEDELLTLGEAAVEALAKISRACAESQTPLIHLSSAQVFDGLSEGRHSEEQPAEPDSARALLAWRLEELLREDCIRHIILRSSELFSAVGDNTLTRLLRQLRAGGTVALSAQGQNSPVHASDLARVVCAVIDQLGCGAEVWGNYHYCSADPVTRFQFAETVLAIVSQYIDIASNGLSLQPLDEVDPNWVQPILSCEKIRNTFGIKQLLWRAFISASVRELMESERDE